MRFLSEWVQSDTLFFAGIFVLVLLLALVVAWVWQRRDK
jgi:hypothetical protein